MNVTFHTGETQFPDSIFNTIATAFLGEKHLLPTTGAALMESYSRGLAVVGMNDLGEPVAYTRLIPLLAAHATEQFLELGSTWVRADCRKRGINHDMYRLLLPLHNDKNILATTTSEDAFDVGKGMGFVHIARRALPEAVWKATCICSATKTGCALRNVACRLAFGEPQHRGPETCWVRVTARTAARYGLTGIAG